MSKSDERHRRIRNICSGILVSAWIEYLLMMQKFFEWFTITHNHHLVHRRSTNVAAVSRHCHRHRHHRSRTIHSRSQKLLLFCCVAVQALCAAAFRFSDVNVNRGRERENEINACRPSIDSSSLHISFAFCLWCTAAMCLVARASAMRIEISFVEDACIGVTIFCSLRTMRATKERKRTKMFLSNSMRIIFYFHFSHFCCVKICSA